MSFSPSPAQTLLLWRLLVHPGPALQKDFKPRASVRDAMR